MSEEDIEKKVQLITEALKEATVYVPKEYEKYPGLFGGDFKFRDTRDVWKNLINKNVPIATKEVLEDLWKQPIKDELKMDPALLYIATTNSDIGLSEHKQKLKAGEDTVLYLTSDAVYDIRVKNATYASFGMYYFPSHPIKMEKDGDDFVLRGVSLENPLWRTISGQLYVINTDGTEVAYTSIFIHPEYRKLFSKNSHMVSWLDDETILMAGNMFMPSTMTRKRELLLVHNII